MQSKVIVSQDSTETSYPIVNCEACIIGKNEKEVSQKTTNIFRQVIKEFADKNNINISESDIIDALNDGSYYFQEKNKVLYEVHVLIPEKVRSLYGKQDNNDERATMDGENRESSEVG